MDKTGNYEKMAEGNRKHFLEFDQEQIFRKFDLDHDDREIRFRMLGKSYILERSSGIITDASGREPSVNVRMTVYDMFCHSAEKPVLSGTWAGIAELGGIIGASHETSLRDPELAAFAGKTEEIRKACSLLGGKEQKQGDASSILPVFDFFPVWYQFWDADEDFPPSETFLWDSNALRFLHYETLWYVMGFMKDEIRKYAGGGA